MSRRQVLNLIRSEPAQLFTQASTLLQPKASVDTIEKVLVLFREAQSIELTDNQRKILRNRLMLAARRLQLLIDYDDSRHGRAKPSQRKAQRNLHLFNEIAETLEMEPQRLQAELV